MLKNIAFVYDNQSVYDIEDSIVFSDFCYDDEARYFKNSLEKADYNVRVFCGAKDFFKAYQQGLDVDIVFNKCEGFRSRNREGLFPSLLEFYNIPYVGTDAYGLSLSLNKFHTKLIAQYLHVPTPQFVLIDNISDAKKKLDFEFPVVLKPNSEGSSMGVKIVENANQLLGAVIDISDKYGFPLICEEYTFHCIQQRQNIILGVELCFLMAHSLQRKK